MKPLTSKLPLVCAVTLASSVSVAQMLEEVVVTAQKREQSLQDVPVAVTAYSSLALEQAGIQTIADLERSTPNTTLRPSRATNSTLTAYIRGIGQNDPLWGFEPGVGVYIDDVYFARPQGAMLDVYDIERVEILRGPQGSLYGKNTIGGAIKYITRRMSGEPEIGVKTSLGNYSQRDVQLTGQIPIIADKLFVGATLASFNRDGFGENKFTNTENYDKDIAAARLSVEFNPTNNVFMRLAGDFTQDDSNNRTGSRLVPSQQTGEPAATDVFDSNGGAGADQEVTNSGVNFTVEWDLSDSLKLKSISAYREGDTEGFIDFDGTPVNVFDTPVHYADHQFTQEIQFNYSAESLDLVGGLYYLDGAASGEFDVIAGAALGEPAVIPTDARTPTFNAATAGTADTESKAAYLHASWSLSDALTLTLGGRYTQDKKEATVYKAQIFTDGAVRNGASPAFGGTQLDLLNEQSNFTDDDSWNQFTPKVGVDYQLGDDTLLYASYAEGFKSGGINMRADVSAAPEGFSNVFDPEEAKSYELGVKTEFADSRVRINAAAFHTNYDSVQVTSTALVGNNFVPAVITDNKQTIDGLEFELTAQLTNSLSALFNVGYIDAEWDRFIVAGVNNADNTSVANVPDIAGMFALNYADGLGRFGSFALNASISYTDDIAVEVNTPDQLIDADSYTLFNLDATWYSPDQHFTVGLHGKNLSDEEYRIAGYNFPDFLGDDSILGFYGDPRTVTLSVGYKF